MNVGCPECGAQFPILSGLNDIAAREVAKIATDLPGRCGVWALQYLGLFRPPGRGVTWVRAKKLMTEIRTLIEAPEISWKQGRPLPNSPEAWQRAMEDLCCRTGLRLPLGNHNLLRAIAYEKAEELDKARERHHETDVRQRGLAEGRGHRPESEETEKARRVALDAIAKMKAGFGR